MKGAYHASANNNDNQFNSGVRSAVVGRGLASRVQPAQELAAVISHLPF